MSLEVHDEGARLVNLANMNNTLVNERLDGGSVQHGFNDGITAMAKISCRHGNMPWPELVSRVESTLQARFLVLRGQR